MVHVPSLSAALPPMVPITEILDNIYGPSNWTPVGFDELWSNPNGGATAIAKYAGVWQTFGYISGSNGGSFNPLFEVKDDGYSDGTLSATFSQAETGYVFRFADAPSWTPLSSQASDNYDGLDHMKTFLITAGPSTGNYALGWEDVINLGDADYQDLVVEVSGVSPVPTPTAFLLGSIGLVYTSWKLRRRREL